MMAELANLPPTVLVIASFAVVGIVLTLVDLARQQVTHLPKWAWALIITFITFPMGAILYFVLGRIPAGQQKPAEPVEGQPADAPLPVRAPVPEGPEPAPARPAATGPPVVVTTGLGKRYGDTAALDDVGLVVPEGAVYGLIGPNGAGKTTMLSILAGLRRPSSGRIDIAVPRTALGVLVDTPQFEAWLTAYEVVDLARHLTAPELPGGRIDAVLEEVGLGAAAHRRTGGFSRGMLQRLGLAACLVGEPEVLILDEPCSALDPAGRREVLDLIGRLGQEKTVVLSTHILADVQQVCDTVAVIDHGRLRFQGPLADLLGRTTSTYTLHVRAPGAGGDAGATGNGLVTALRAQNWVTDIAEQAPGRLRLVVSDAPRAESAIPRLLTDHGVGLVSFNPATDLETAFLELTS